MTLTADPKPPKNSPDWICRYAVLLMAAALLFRDYKGTTPKPGEIFTLVWSIVLFVLAVLCYWQHVKDSK